MKNFFKILFLSLFVLNKLYAQSVGFNIINTNDPSNTAILDLSNSNEKGLLIPRLTTAQVNAMPLKKHGLFVFNTTECKFSFYDTANGGEWKYILDCNLQFSSYQKIDGNFGINTDPSSTHALSVSGIIDVSGTSVYTKINGNVTVNTEVDETGVLKANDFGLNLYGNGMVPAGTIAMWNSSTAPTGWQLCDGSALPTSTQAITGLTNSPDLRNQFIYSTNDTTLFRTTGGSNTVTLTESQMPQHSHVIDGVGNHTHTYQASTQVGTGLGQITGNIGDSQTNSIGMWLTFDNYTTSGAGGHSHSMNYTGSGTAVDIRPQYYVLTYIIKK